MKIIIVIISLIILISTSSFTVDAIDDETLFDGAVKIKNLNIEKSRLIENEGSWRGYCNGIIMYEKIAAKQNPEIIIDREFLDAKTDFWVYVFPSGTNYSCINIFTGDNTMNPNFVKHELDSTDTHRTITFEIPPEISSEESYYHEIVILGDIFGQSTHSQSIDLTNPDLIKTWNVGITSMPKHWEEDFEGVTDDAFDYWECRLPGIDFEITGKTVGNDFSIQWQTKTTDGLLGYFRDAHMQSEPYVAVTLGQIKDGKIILTEKEYVKQILTHEIGHALGFEHIEDNREDIMFPSIYNYEEWKKSPQEFDRLKCGDMSQDSIPTSSAVVAANTDNLSPNNSSVDVPSWIKNDAKGWAEDSMDDKIFALGIQRLIQENIIHVDTPTGGTEVMIPESDNIEIPEWIKNNAKWFSEGGIDNDEYLNGITYLVENGIIKVS